MSVEATSPLCCEVNGTIQCTICKRKYCSMCNNIHLYGSGAGDGHVICLCNAGGNFRWKLLGESRKAGREILVPNYRTLP